jgi:RHS repeat-associated protein
MNQRSNRRALPRSPLATGGVCALQLCFGLAVLAQSPRLQVDTLPSREVRLSWPASATGFELEETPTLAPGAVWSPVGALPQTEDGELVVRIAPSSTSRFFRLRQTSAALTRIAETSPAHGENGVAVTRETILRFTAPLAADTTVGGEQLYASFGGRRLLSRVQLSADRRTLTLFYLAPLPGAARVRVTLVGTGLKDAQGREVDVDGDGTPGGTAVIDFNTLALAPLADTAVTGRVFASELAPSPGGQSMSLPLAGVTISVDGMEETLRTVTDQFGNFRLAPVPAGDFFVHIDGRTAMRTAENPFPEGAYYPFVNKRWTSLAGQEVNVGNVYLPLVVEGTLQPVSAVQDTVITFPQAVLDTHPELAGVTLTVPANALYADDGTRGGRVGIAPVPPDRLPSPLPPGLEFPLVITVQSDGAGNFDQPVPVCFPNLPDPVTGRTLPPGAKSALFSFNHDIGEWEMAGPMTVSADGMRVCTDPGVGIRQPGWHGTRPGNQAGGGNTRGGRHRPPTRPRPTGDQECAKNDCPCEGTCRTGSEVFLHSGEEVLTREDLVIPGRAGMDFRMDRTYRSRLDYNGPLGHGWTFRYNETLFFEPNGDVTRFTGRSHGSTWTLTPDGTYAAPPGHFGLLLREPDGTFLLVESDGFQRLYRPEDGRVFCHIDRYGNRMLFDYDDRGNLARVIDVFGREIQFVFEPFADGVDRLVRIEDFMGRQVRYEYDERGDLMAVTTPAVTGTSTGNDFPEGRTERYTYSSGFAQPELNHNILTLTAPEEVANGGPPRLQWTYGTNPNDPLTLDRVLAETEGGTNASGVPAGGTRRFEYAMLNQNEPLGQPDLPRGRARITERNGNVKEFFVNERQLHILTRELTRGFREGEPEAYETRSYFDNDGQLVRRAFPEGNEVRYTYDTTGPRRSRSNVIERRQIADAARGGGPDIVTNYTYEPLFNQPLTVTDPRGNDPSFTPPLGSQSAARYTKRFFYDYQESTAPVPLAELLGIDLSTVPRGLGDLNGDGRTDQTFGNLIRVEAPPVRLRPDSNEAARLGATTQPVISQTQWNDYGQTLARIDPEGNVTDYEYFPEDDPDGDGQKTFAPYVALRPDTRNGYLAAVTVDSRPSPRRDPTAPAPVALTTRYAYDPVGNVIGVRDPRGVWAELEVNQLNEVVAVIAGADITAAVASGQLLTGEAAFGYRTRFHYDHNGRVVRKEVENRDETTPGVGPFVDQRFTFDILDNVLSTFTEVDAQGGVLTQFRYDPEELLGRTVQPEGNAIEITYDERNLPLTLTRGAGTPEAATVRFDYDRNGNRLRVTDAEDNDGDGRPEVARYAYDGFDRRVAAIDPLGNRRELAYDPASNEVRRRVLGHPPGQPGAPAVLLEDRRFHYDELNRLFRIDEALFVAAGFAPMRTPQLHDQNGDGLVTTFQEFDAASRLTFRIEDDGETHAMRYDGAHRRLLTRDPLGNSVSVVYDQNSNPVRVVAHEVSAEGLVPAEDFVTVSVYDQLDRLVRRTDNAGQTTRYTYDSRHNLIGESDPQGPPMADPLGLVAGQINGPGNTTAQVYDGLNRLVQTTRHIRQGGSGSGALDTSNPFNPDGSVTVSYRWDGNSRLTGIRDDNGNLTAFAYDALNRRTRQVNADATAYQFVYDRDDNLVQVTDPNGTVVRHGYDALNRRVRSEVTQFAPGVAGSRLSTFEYDGLSRLTRSTDDNGEAPTRVQPSVWVYDSLSRLIEEQQNGRAVSTRLSGDGKRLATIYPGGRRIDRSFDAIDRVQRQLDGALALSECRYIGPAGRELARILGNQTAMSYLDDAGLADVGYDAVQRPVRQRVFRGGVPLLDREYAYNRADRRTLEKRHDDGGLMDAYAYDSLYRVVTTELDLDGPPAAPRRDLEAITYALDGAGNRREVQQRRTSDGPTVTPHTVNEVNEYTQIAGVTRVYSENGNLRDDGDRLFTYDYRNRLIAVRRKADQALVAEYLYDTDNRRREKRLFDPAAPGTLIQQTRFFYDGWQVCEEQNGAGQTTTTYVHAPGYIDDLVQMERTAAHPLGPGAVYFHQNARYDVVALTDATGAVVERTSYDDFGRAYDGAKQPVAGSAVGNPYGFQGRRLDPETGLYYFRHRYYDPQTGRFLQRDPVWDPGNVANLYTFAQNNPASHLDPSGLKSGTGRTGGTARSSQPRPMPPPGPNLADDAAIQGMGGVSRVLNAAGTLSRTKWGVEALKTGEAAAEYTQMYNQIRFLENMSNLNHAGPDVSNLYRTTMKVEQLEKTVQAAGGVEDAARAGRTAKAMRAAGHVGNALQVAEVGANAVDYYRKDERVTRLAASERERILNEYDRLVREALALRARNCDPTELQRIARLREELLTRARENMEYQLNNVTDSQITEHLMNGAVFLRDSLATFVPLPTGWLWGNKTEEGGRP